MVRHGRERGRLPQRAGLEMQQHRLQPRPRSRRAARRRRAARPRPADGRGGLHDQAHLLREQQRARHGRTERRASALEPLSSSSSAAGSPPRQPGGCSVVGCTESGGGGGGAGGCCGPFGPFLLPVGAFGAAGALGGGSGCCAPRKRRAAPSTPLSRSRTPPPWACSTFCAFAGRLLPERLAPAFGGGRLGLFFSPAFAAPTAASTPATAEGRTGFSSACSHPSPHATHAVSRSVRRFSGASRKLSGNLG